MTHSNLSKKEFVRPLFLPDISTFFNQDIGLANEMINRLMDTDIEVI